MPTHTQPEGVSLRLQIKCSIESIIAILGQIPTDGAALMLRIFVQDQPRDLSHHKIFMALRKLPGAHARLCVLKALLEA
jgi:hypothetical protein